MFLPIAIGNFEATAIYMELYNEPPPRPITYDLLRSILEGFDIQVKQVLINALKDDTFYAEILLFANGHEVKIDSRPSDALALALRVGAPIYVEEAVIREAGLAVKKQVDSPAEQDDRSENALLAVMMRDEAAAEQDMNTSQEADNALDQMTQLKARLQEAVAREEYEEAARIRDEIGRLEHHGH